MNTRHLMLLAGLGLVACTKPVDTPRPEFGEAVRNNMAMQIINPEPPESMELPPSDGVRRAVMMDRYQRDEVEPLDPTTTSGIQVAPARAE
jgi:type IV pilus biogenesis protein CpaD/CtpE